MATHSGSFSACGHTVKFWYKWDGRGKRVDLEQLEVEAESRAREMIAEDYTSGELNATEYEIRGAWHVDN